MKKQTTYHSLPTRSVDMNIWFDILSKFLSLYKEGFKTKKAIAKNYSEYDLSRTPRTIKRYMRDFEDFNLVARGREQFSFTSIGQNLVEEYNLSKSGENPSYHLNKFNKMMKQLLCSGFEAQIRGNKVNHFLYLSMMLDGLEGEVYDYELLLLFFTQNAADVEDLIRFSKEFRELGMPVTLFKERINSLRQSGVSERDLSYVVEKLLPVPKKVFETIGYIENTGGRDYSVRINEDTKISFTKSIKIKY